MANQNGETNLAVLTAGWIKQNPTFVQVLGMCPVLAVSTSAENALGMGLATLGVLAISNLFISFVRNIIPNEIRIPVYISIIAAFVTMVNLLMHGYTYSLWVSLGIYIPLIVVNCVPLGRAEAFASKHGPWKSFLDGLGMGIGFLGAIMLIGITRELFDAGTIFGYHIWSSAYNVFVVALPPGAFLVIGLYMGLFRYIGKMRSQKKVQGDESK
ncbi:MAG: electron transport complex subunit RsxE [Mesoaciditoga sp.]|uniref:electron transport complex subunit RsxE n=1 Tax=Athalassotoga sp. TaxID=2022597 RepID=UPI000CC68900|nr:MAG: electron transport complex subunit RsxE [Mesoaciditoga sp.]PMP80444.1 MAG: electron transport complex subunit RsxE [Mesoaciditoga sp.]